MPQKTIPQAGKQKRHAYLGISLRQLQVAILDIQKILLILPHPIQLFLRIGCESHSQLVIPADDRLEKTAPPVERAILSRLCQKQFPLTVVKRKHSAGIFPLFHHPNNFPIPDFTSLFPNRDYSLRPLLRQKRIIRILRLPQHGASHPQSVFSPRLHNQRLSIPTANQPVCLLKHPLHNNPPVSFPLQSIQSVCPLQLQNLMQDLAPVIP